MGPGSGVPPLKGHGTSGLKYYEMEMGYLQGVDRHTLVKTVPSPFLRNAGGNNDSEIDSQGLDLE